ncbi:hypothetical protein GCM10028808_21100 [Spirosoma migulaei]
MTPMRDFFLLDATNRNVFGTNREVGLGRTSELCIQKSTYKTTSIRVPTVTKIRMWASLI